MELGRMVVLVVAVACMQGSAAWGWQGAAGQDAAAGTAAMPAGKAPKKLKVQLLTSKGQPAGVATLKQGKDGVALKLSAENLPFGEHGVHIHQSPACDAPDFKSAGGHFNPDSRHHGFENPEGHHAGDTPGNLQVGEDHRGEASWFLHGVTLAPGAANSLLGSGGTSLVIHEKADDMKSDPSGNSGNRIACGVIRQ